MTNFKTWQPMYRDTPAERQMYVRSVIQELTGRPAGDHSVYVAGDTLVYGTVDVLGDIHIFETEIRASNQDASEMAMDGDACVTAIKGD